MHAGMQIFCCPCPIDNLCRSRSCLTFAVLAADLNAVFGVQHPDCLPIVACPMSIILLRAIVPKQSLLLEW